MQVNLHRISHLFYAALVGNDDLIRHLDRLVLIMCYENTGNSDLIDRLS